MAVAWGRDTGILIKLRRNIMWTIVGPQHHHLSTKVDNKLVMDQVLPSFILYGIGMATSVVAFCLERLWNKCMKQNVISHDTDTRKKAWEKV